MNKHKKNAGNKSRYTGKFFSSMLAIFVMLFLVFAINPGSAKAAPASTVYFSQGDVNTPVTTVSATNGTTFTLNPTINTGTNAVSIVSLHITFDATKLSLDTPVIASTYSSSTPFATAETNLSTAVDNSAGTATFDVSVGNANPSATGTFSLATLTFHAIATGSAQIAFAPTTGAGADGETGNVIVSGGMTSVTATISASSGDTTPPTVTAFTLPLTSSSLTVPISTFTATDDSGSVAGYCITTTNDSSACAWTGGPPSTYTFSSAGSQTLYGWAKDPSGNVSVYQNSTLLFPSVSYANTTITLADSIPPTVTAFTLPSTSSSLTVPISSFTATDNVGVTGYLVTLSSTAPSATAGGWTSTPPTSVTFSSAGSQTAYAWAKDADLNVSASLSATTTITPPVGSDLLGGTVTGLSGNVSIINGNQVVATGQNGAFTFPNPLTDGTSYSVSIDIQPATQTCTVTNGTGSISASSVNAVTVTCADTVQDQTPDQGDTTPNINIPKPKVTVDDNGRSLSSYFMDDKDIKLHSTISDLAKGKVRVTKDGKLIASSKIDSKGKWSVKIGFSSTTTIKVYYYDNTGSEVGSKKYQIKIDSQAPKFTDLPLILHKAAGGEVYWTATDNQGIDHYRYQIDGKLRDTHQSHFYLSSTISRGAHNVDVTAVDKAGNETTQHIVVWVW